MYQCYFLSRKNYLRIILLIKFITDIDRTGSGYPKIVSTCSSLSAFTNNLFPLIFFIYYLLEFLLFYKNKKKSPKLQAQGDYCIFTAFH